VATHCLRLRPSDDKNIHTIHPAMNNYISVLVTDKIHDIHHNHNEEFRAYVNRLCPTAYGYNKKHGMTPNNAVKLLLCTFTFRYQKTGKELTKDEAVSKILHSYQDRMVNLRSEFPDKYPPTINEGRFEDGPIVIHKRNSKHFRGTIASKWLDFDRGVTAVKDQIVAEIDDMYCFVGMSSSTSLAFI
jgi:hypothetical protein